MKPATINHEVRSGVVGS